jgi:subtilase family serine protease
VKAWPLGKWVLFVAIILASSKTQAQQSSRISSGRAAPSPQIVDHAQSKPPNRTPAGLASLSRSVPRAALSAEDLGPIPDETLLPSLAVYVARTPKQNTALRKLLIEQQTPGNANYHRWLSPEEFGARFGISAEDEATVRDWLASQGYTHVTVSRSRTAFRFVSTAGQAAAAFHTSIHRLTVQGETHFSNLRDLQVPAAVETLVQHIGGLTDFQPRPASDYRRMHPQYTEADKVGYYLFAPGDMATEFDLTPLYNSGIDGTGITVAVIGIGEVDLSSVATYRADYNLPVNTPTSVLVNSDPNPANMDDFEAQGDLELLGAVARNANLVYVHDANLDNAVQYAVDQKIGSVINFSYGAPEDPAAPGYDYFYQMLAQQANAEGITFVASSGDFGPGWNGPNNAEAIGELVQFPADIPEITGVGGTGLVYPFQFGSANDANGGSLTGYNAETGWGEGFANALSACDNGSGGGVSQIFPKPSWQQGNGVPNDSFRDVPDVAMLADEPYGICYDGDCAAGPPLPDSTQGSMFDGTSASAPVFAGIIALVNHYLIQNQVISAPGLGNVNPTLYQLAASQPSAFHDITTGNNIVPCNVGTPDCPSATGPWAAYGYGSYGYTAGPGYDQVTGLGTIDGYNLAFAWSSVAQTGTTATLTANQTPIVSGSDLGLLLTVEVASTETSGIPEGGVSFYLNTWTKENGLLGIVQLDGTGTATLRVENLGSQSTGVYAEYGGNGTFSQSLTNQIPVTATTTTTLMASASQIAVGGSVTLTATVTATGSTVNAGTVTFLDGSTSLGTATVSNGAAQITTTVLPIGSDQITASYAGTPAFAASASSAISINVAAPSTTTALTISPNATSLQAGSSYTLTATVTPSTGSTVPTGSVIFTIGSATQTVALNASGVATYTGTAPTASGSLSMSAAYQGSTEFATSTSNTLTETIVTIPSTTALTISPNSTSLQAGSNYTLTATVTPSTGSTVPTGSVVFTIGSATQTVALNASGVATYTGTAPTASGSLSLSAAYQGSTEFATSTSNTLSETITAVPTTTALSITPTGSLQAGSSYTLTATVTPSTGSTVPTGSVIFTIGSATQTVALNASGVATYTGTAPTASGSLSMSAAYQGSTEFAASTPSTLSETITAIPSTTALTISPNATSLQAGSSYTLTATVTPSTGSTVPTGGVIFTIGSATQTVALNASGVATYTGTAPTASGSLSMSAAYQGSTEFAASTSRTLSETITAIPSTTALAISPNATSLEAGSSYTLTAIVTPSSGSTTPTGSVIFTMGSATQTVALNSSGMATYTGTAPVASGSLSLSAAYQGSTEFATSASNSLTESIITIPTTTALVISPNSTSLQAGSSYTLAATVTPSTGSTVPTGSVVFTIGSATQTVALNASGVATYTGTAPAASGSLSLSAAYQGSSEFASSTSTTLTESVITIPTTTALTISPSSTSLQAGSSYTLTATVAPSSGSTVPAGSVIFTIGSATQTVVLNSSGVATYTGTAPAASGSLSLSAAYQGSTEFSSSTSSTLTESIIVSAAASTFSVTPGTYASAQTVAINDSTPGAAIYYTTNGTTPTTSSMPYTGPITVSATETIEAIATASGYSQSPVASATYTINLPAAAPAFSLAQGTYTSAQPISLSDTTPGATIYYTTNGSTPTTSSTPYSGPITVSTTETIEAVAIASGYSLSPVNSATYTINLANPVPTLTSISPGYVATGNSGFALTVGGTGLVPGSTIYWGSAALTTQYVSATQLTAQVPGSAVASAGETSITVQNPAPGGGASSALRFEVDSGSTGTAPVFGSVSAAVTAGSTASYSVTLPSTASAVTATCLNLPVGATCNYSASTGAVTITTLSTTPAGSYQITVVFTETLAGSASGFVLMPFLLLPLATYRKRLASRWMMFVACSGILMLMLAAVTGCGGDGGASGGSTTTAPQTHQVTNSATVTLTVK